MYTIDVIRNQSPFIMIKYSNTQHKIGWFIGKADKYYTLWYVYKPHNESHWFGNTVQQHFQYIQNLSFEKDEAIEKVKNMENVDEFELDEELRGSGSYKNDISIEYNDDVFLFGKYKERKFSDVDDLDYKQWYYKATKGTEKESSLLKEELSDLIFEFNGEEIHIDQLKEKALKLYEEEFRKKNFFGVEGEKAETLVRFRKSYGFDTYYGYMNVYEFVNKDGYLLYYKGAKELDVDEDAIYKLSGKIKHNKYYSNYHHKEVKETQFQYPKIEKIKEIK